MDLEVVEAAEALRAAGRASTTIFTLADVFGPDVDDPDEVYGPGLTLAGSIPMIDRAQIAEVFGRATLDVAVSDDDTLMLCTRLSWPTSDGVAHSTMARYQITARDARVLAGEEEVEEDPVTEFLRVGLSMLTDGDEGPGVTEAVWEQVIDGVTTDFDPYYGEADAIRAAALYHSAAIRYAMSRFPELVMLGDEDEGVVGGRELVTLAGWVARRSLAGVPA